MKKEEKKAEPEVPTVPVPSTASMPELVELTIDPKNPLVFDVETRGYGPLVAAYAHVKPNTLLGPGRRPTGRVVPRLWFESVAGEPPVKRRVALLPPGGWIAEPRRALIGSIQLPDDVCMFVYELPFEEPTAEPPTADEPPSSSLDVLGAIERARPPHLDDPTFEHHDELGGEGEGA